MILHSSCHFLNPNFWDIFEKAKTTEGIFHRTRKQIKNHSKNLNVLRVVLLINIKF
jgi:hypothetical protein